MNSSRTPTPKPKVLSTPTPEMTDNSADGQAEDTQTETGGEPVCWLNRVCDVCGALVDTSLETCWRCDTPLESS